MSDHEHTINRADSTRSNTDKSEEDDEDEEEDEQRSEAEIKRELRKNEVGRAILGYNRRRRGAEVT